MVLYFTLYIFWFFNYFGTASLFEFLRWLGLVAVLESLSLTYTCVLPGALIKKGVGRSLEAGFDFALARLF